MPVPEPVCANVERQGIFDRPGNHVQKVLERLLAIRGRRLGRAARM
jgi:hypothetical protein